MRTDQLPPDNPCCWVPSGRVAADVLLVMSRCALAFMVELFDAFAHAFVGKGVRVEHVESHEPAVAPRRLDMSCHRPSRTPGEAPALASRRPRA